MEGASKRGAAAGGTKARARAPRPAGEDADVKDAAQTPQFAPIRTRRVFEEICAQVRNEMAAGTLRPGDKLPAERDLAIKFGVSRTAVREALRSLEIAGVVGLQKGVKGGAFILKGDPDLVTRSIRDMFYLGRISVDNLTEARTLVMQMAMELACTRIGPTTVSALERNVDKLAALPRTGHVAERVALGTEFYGLIAQATENTVVQVIVEALTEIVLQQVERTKINPLPDLVGHRRRLIGYLVEGREADAKREITEHLQRLHRHLIKEWKAAAQRRVQARQEPA